MASREDRAGDLLDRLADCGCGGGAAAASGPPPVVYACIQTQGNF